MENANLFLESGPENSKHIVVRAWSPARHLVATAAQSIALTDGLLASHTPINSKELSCWDALKVRAEERSPHMIRDSSGLITGVGWDCQPTRVAEPYRF